VLNAEAEATRSLSIALARAASFTNQLPAYRAAPGIYTERAYQQTLAKNGAKARKYVVLTTNTIGRCNTIWKKSTIAACSIRMCKYRRNAVKNFTQGNHMKPA